MPFLLKFSYLILLQLDLSPQQYLTSVWQTVKTDAVLNAHRFTTSLILMQTHPHIMSYIIFLSSPHTLLCPENGI